MKPATAVALDIAVIDDEAVVRETLGEFLTRKGHRVRPFSDGPAACAAFATNPPDLALLDIRMPGSDGLDLLDRIHADHPELPIVMISGHGTMDTAIEAMRLGAVDFLRKPIRYPDLMAALERVARLMAVERDRDRLRATLARSQAASGDDGFITASAACRDIADFLAGAAATPFDSVLIVGETGTGKDVLARELHRRRHGAEAPFVAVNCPALPDTLVESELFGHMRGAFTGADNDRPGAFELADGGTLFLDELGDLARPAQAKLLRTLESRLVRRLGGRKDLPVAVTVIAATNQDLQGMVADGSFRRDLLFRLNTFQLAIPPLRERREDIPVLARHFLERCATRHRMERRDLSDEALRALCQYDFPGNARELRNIIERAALLCRCGRIEARCLALPAAAMAAAAEHRPPTSAQDPEAQATHAALVANRWNRRATARSLGITYEALRWRIEKHGLST